MWVLMICKEITMKHDSKKFNIEYKAILDSFNTNNDVRIWVVQPSTSIYQKIENFSVSHKPKKSYRDRQENKISYFEFKSQKNITIQVNIQATLWKNKINLKKEDVSLPRISTKLFKQYTKSEKFLEQTPEIKKLTHQITKKDKFVLDKIQSIFNFIVENFKYCHPVKQRGVKYLNLNNLRGDCGEYSSLFVTMCRILKIPARNNTGFVLFTKQKKIVEHGWASVYLKPYSWIDIDTQYASLEKNVNIGAKKYFAQRNDYRMTFVNGFNISLKPAIPQNFQLNYWNKLGLPLTYNSVQTLQPIVFASKEKVRFKDNIKII